MVQLRHLALVPALLLVAANAVYVVLDREDWPLSSAPMYSHAITPEGPRVRFALTREGGVPVALRGMRKSSSWRSFWKHAWRDPSRREARVSAYLTAVAQRQRKKPKQLDLWWEEVRAEGDKDQVTARRHLARWSPSGTKLTEAP